MFNNMLSEDKVKLHGMQTSKWTIHQKLAQYKGIVDLYEQDVEQLKRDTIKEEATLKKDIVKLRKYVNDQQTVIAHLDKANEQAIKNTLAENRDFLLAYQHYPTSRITEELLDKCFNMRRDLDTAFYDLRKKTEKLIFLTLEYARMEDSIKYEKSVAFPDNERQIRILSSQVEEYGLKRDAAAVINDTYKRMMKILEKDEIYFDAVLNALEIDGYNQSKCLLRVLEMGQLCAEYVDDKKKEIQVLEKAIKHNVAEGDALVQKIKSTLEDLDQKIKSFTHQEDNVDIEALHKDYREEPEYILRKRLEDTRHTLETIRMSCYATSIDDILPRLKRQNEQKDRIKELLDIATQEREALRLKLRHAKLMYHNVRGTMVKTTAWFNSEKEAIMSEIDETITLQKKTEYDIERLGKLKLNLRVALQHFAELLRNVVPSEKQVSRKKKMPVEEEPDDEAIDELPTESKDLLSIVHKKLTDLRTNVERKSLDESQKRMAAKEYQNFVSDMLPPTLLSRLPAPLTSLVNEINFEDPGVPTRQQIKAASAEIVSRNAKSEFDMPALAVKKS